VRKRFKEHLIVLDPVDPNRNVASAVSQEAFWTLTEAARAFLKKPKKVFFFPREVESSCMHLLEEIRKRASNLLFIAIKDDDVEVPDVLWGQLHKSKKAIAKHLEKADFNVFRSAVWSDEKTKHIFIFELEDVNLPSAMKKMGPPVEMAKNGESFVKKHLEAEETISGPWIEGNRWWVEAKRVYTDGRSFLAKTLQNGGGSIGVSRLLSRKIKLGSQIMVDEDISEQLDEGFKDFLAIFLKGRPGWLD